MDSDCEQPRSISEESVVLSDRNVFVAEKIIRKRRSKTGVYEYFIKWQGWPHKYNTWEPEYNILDDSLVESFAEGSERKGQKKKRKHHRVPDQVHRWQAKHRLSSAAMSESSGQSTPTSSVINSHGKETMAKAPELTKSMADSKYVKNVSICLLECRDSSAGNVFDNVLWSLNSHPKRRSSRHPGKSASRQGSTEIEVDRVKVKIVEIPVEKCELQVATDHVNLSDSQPTQISAWNGFNSNIGCTCPLSPLNRSTAPFVELSVSDAASVATSSGSNSGSAATRRTDGSLFEMLDLQYLHAPFYEARQIVNSTTAMSLKVTSVMSVANTVYADA